MQIPQDSDKMPSLCLPLRRAFTEGTCQITWHSWLYKVCSIVDIACVVTS